MNKKLVRTFLVIAFGIGTSSWALAQEEPAAPKKATPAAVHEAKAKAVAKKVETRAKTEAARKAKAVNINAATKAELMALPGITDELAQRIIQNRPYNSKGFLVTKNAVPSGIFQGIRKLVYAGPLPAKAK
ncbi:MAG TPA: helix-hairpin-helix domain-containing protein [Geothrix sp.]|nr:helix-hairpin-helix domain-containing protein [Geothrix sp.]